MTISKVYDEDEAEKLGFDEDEDDRKPTYEEWFERYGDQERD